MSRRAEIVCNAQRENLGALLQFVERFTRDACLAREDADAVRLAAEEACVNVISYGYAGRPAGPVTLRMDRSDTQVTIEVEDRGIAFDPTTIVPARIDLPLEHREVGGLGWHLIKQVMDDVRHERTGDGNKLTLVKHLRAAGAVQER